ncbi:MAG: radical SAM protein [Candidatus Omnitrophica bacterium]|nr:radical SAM protein [Candidatus Omnitrophota bacterium]
MKNKTMHDRPVSINIELTKRCVLNCKMCHAWKISEEKEELTIKELKGLIDSLPDVFDSDIAISFGGGEPFLKEGILDIVSVCAGRGYRTIIPTNAFLIDRAMAKKIVDSGLEIIFISLDSLKEETHDYLRGKKGVYNNLMRAIDHISELKKETPRIQISTLITGKNLEDLIGLARWACTDKRLFGISFQAVTAPFYTPEGPAWYLKDEYRELWPKDKTRLKEIIEELIELKGQGLKIWNPVSQLRMFLSYYDNPECFIRKRECHLGRDSLGVGSCGDVFLCYLMEPINNIRDYNLKDIWNNQRAVTIRQRIKECKKNCQILVNCWFEEEKP